MAAGYIEQAYGKHYLPCCTICGRHIYRGDLPLCGVAKRATGGHVFWHRGCYEERYGKTPEEYDGMLRAELQTELEPEQQRELDRLRKGRGMKTESIWALVFEDGKCWRERRDGYPTRADGVFACKTRHQHIKGKSATWETVDAGTGLRLTGPFGTKRECEASIDDGQLEKLARFRESHRYRGAVRANELVYARGSMPSDEYNRMRERYAAEELDKFKEENMKENGWKEAPKSAEPVIAQAIESLEGERVCITGTLAGMSRQEAFIRLKSVGGVPCERFTGKTTLFVIAANAGRSKRGKADAAIAKGQAVRIVDGSTFVKALKEAEQELAAKAVEQKAKRKSGAKVEAKATEHADVTTVEMAPVKDSWNMDSCEHFGSVLEGKKVHCKKHGIWTNCMEVGHCTLEGREVERDAKVEEKEEADMKERIEELEAKLKAMSNELEEVWKENATLKARPQGSVPPAPKPPKSEPKVEDAAASVSLETMQAWCEGKGLIATQKAEGCCIWVEGDSKAYADELKQMDFRFAKKRKSWYYDPKRAA